MFFFDFPGTWPTSPNRHFLTNWLPLFLLFLFFFGPQLAGLSRPGSLGGGVPKYLQTDPPGFQNTAPKTFNFPDLGFEPNNLLTKIQVIGFCVQV